MYLVSVDESIEPLFFMFSFTSCHYKQGEGERERERVVGVFIIYSLLQMRYSYVSYVVLVILYTLLPSITTQGRWNTIIQYERNSLYSFPCTCICTSLFHLCISLVANMFINKSLDHHVLNKDAKSKDKVDLREWVVSLGCHVR